MEARIQVEPHAFGDGGWCPNSRFPLLVYRRSTEAQGESAATEFESIFAANGWPPAWRYTIFDYPHFHSTAHEVIGIYSGQATVRFGDSVGIEMKLNAGDAVLIPAGVSHQCLRSTRDFQGVGAYPEGCRVDEMRPDNSDRPESDRRILQLPRPACDPVLGNRGPMNERWRPG